MGFESLKTSGARWRGSVASGSAALMSSPGACPLTGSALAYRQFGFAAVAWISVLGSEFGIAMSRDIAPQAKARGRFPGAGSILAMLNICR
jgi:hypothetical protein